MSPAAADAPAGRLFTLVVVCEAATIAALWLIGRIFG
jgi:hypothetical protein